MIIPYGRQSIDDDDVEAVVDVLRGDWLTQGPMVSAFENAVAEYCDVPHAVAFSSGTAALHAAVAVAGVKAGDEVVTSALTFAASANCAVYLSARPRFADIDPETWNVTPESVVAVVGSRTRAVIPVHFAGLPAPVDEIREALPDDIVMIEDAAHAIGAQERSTPVGSCRHSDMTIFSFHPVKAITTGEGGMVTTRSESFAERLRRFRTHGITRDPRYLRGNGAGWHQEQIELGFNYRLTDIQSALGCSQLKKLNAFVARRNAIADRYREAFSGTTQLQLPADAPNNSLHAYHLFPVVHRGGASERRRIYDHLQLCGIRAQVHYLPVYLHPWYVDTFGFSPGLCPVAESYYAGCLSLPCFPDLRDDEQKYVIDEMSAVL